VGRDSRGCRKGNRESYAEYVPPSVFFPGFIRLCGSLRTGQHVLSIEAKLIVAAAFVLAIRALDTCPDLSYLVSSPSPSPSSLSQNFLSPPRSSDSRRPLSNSLYTTPRSFVDRCRESGYSYSPIDVDSSLEQDEQQRRWEAEVVKIEKAVVGCFCEALRMTKVLRRRLHPRKCLLILSFLRTRRIG
jgi:hypothetical protein